MICKPEIDISREGASACAAFALAPPELLESPGDAGVIMNSGFYEKLGLEPETSTPIIS